MTIPTSPLKARRTPCCGGGNSDGHHGYTVTYSTQNHCSVLFQCWGSVWYKVFPYCLFNVMMSVILQYGVYRWGWVINVTDKGHSFMTLIVAFLVVSRANVSMARYNQAMGYLSLMCYNTDKLVQMVAIASSEAMNPAGAEWRHEVVYNALVMLRTAMAVMDYRTDGIPGWELPEVEPNLAVTLKEQLFLDVYRMRWAHHSRVSENEENMRVPTRMALLTKKAIRNAGDRVPLLDMASELNMFNIVDSFMVGYFG
jgi:hypothetical protein